MTYDVVFTENTHGVASNFLLKHIHSGQLQEELCFALWRPSVGASRTSALIFEVILPEEGEHHVHKGTSFEPHYLTRVVKMARQKNAGVAFMHSHFTPGWQGMSEPDVVAERDRISPPVRASNFPLVGLTLGTDGSWSARFWTWDGQSFNRSWCDKVRVAGRRLHVTFNDRNVPPPKRQHMLRRTIDTWGKKCQDNLARLRIGIVGLGSVGCVVAESLARMGVQSLVLVDPDKIETHNLDRLLYADKDDVGDYKVEFIARHLRRSATAANFKVDTHATPIQQKDAYLAALDCDALFSAVDRPLPKDLLNHIAYAHCIPLIFGGVRIGNKADQTLGQAAWSVVTAGPTHRCLRCDGQYSSSDVRLERDGSWDDPRYIRGLQQPGNEPVNQNVFPFSASLASFMVLEMVRLVIADRWWPDIGSKLHYTMIPGHLEATEGQCDVNCSVHQKIGLGDAFCYPFIDGAPTDHARDKPSFRFNQLADAVKRFLRQTKAGADHS